MEKWSVSHQTIFHDHCCLVLLLDTAIELLYNNIGNTC